MIGSRSKMSMVWLECFTIGHGGELVASRNRSLQFPAFLSFS